MKTILIAAVVTLIVGSANAETYTYMCKVGSKSYPVTVNETMNGGTISWRGTIFENLELEEGCKVNFVATKNGVKAELCAATKGYADLTIGKAMFNCQMKQ